MQQIFSGKSAPEFHAGMLIVKTAPVPQASGSLGLGIAGGPSGVRTSGLGALALMERAGLVRRITRLDEPSRSTPLTFSATHVPVAGMGVAAALFAGPPPPHMSESPLANSSIVEFDPMQDARTLALELARDPLVESAAPVPVRYLVALRKLGARASSTPNAGAGGMVVTAVPPPTTQMWNLTKIGWAEARANPTFVDANGVKVAVLDTGVDRNHPDLAGRVSGYAFSYADVSEPTSAQDLIGHGTHVTGTITASINNNIGINGICVCDLLSFKIFDDEPDYSVADGAFVYYVNPTMYLKALAACVEAKVDVINLSIGGTGQPTPQEQALFQALIDGGTVVCAAMGNERQFGSPKSFPAAIPGVVAVGATTIDDTVANFSNRGSHIALSAPGSAIWSTLPTYPGQFGFEAVFDAAGKPQQGKPRRRETDYDAWNGTSMATPHVTAAAALLRAKQADLDPAAVRGKLMATADKVSAMQGADHDADYGAGRLNLQRLLS